MSESKVIVITGASSGIGAATALRLAKSGHRVVIGARRILRLKEIVETITAAGGDAVCHTVDVTSQTSVEDFATFAMKRYGRIDVWFNNAGLMPHSPFIEDHLEDWNRMIDVNLRGVLYGIHAALPIMRKQHAGYIINTASVAAHAVHQGGGVYSATKAGVYMISEALRQEEAAAKSGVRVTVVSPGAVQTEIANQIPDQAVRERIQASHDALGVKADRIAATIQAAIDLPADTDVFELIVRPTAQP